MSTTNRIRFGVAPLAISVLLVAAPVATAQVDSPKIELTEETWAAGETSEFGTASESIYNVGADDFSVRLGGFANANLLNNAQIRPLNDSSNLSISGPIHLPAGSLITSLTVFYTDTHTTSDPSGNLWRASGTGGLTNVQTITFPSGFSGGPNNFTVTLPAPGLQVDNLNNHYAVNFSLNRADFSESQGMFRVRVRYLLQVSPAPGIATFGDVPTTHAFFRFVEALAASGITGGCGGGNYCPNDPITRGQMAVFLASALGLHFPN